MKTLRRLNRLKNSKRKTLINIIRTNENSIFGVSDIYAIKQLTRLRLNFSHLNERKFRHNFNDSKNLLCRPHLLRCRLHLVQRAELLDGVYKLDSALENSSEDQLVTVLLCGSKKYTLNVNKEVTGLTISYSKASECFV